MKIRTKWIYIGAALLLAAALTAVLVCALATRQSETPVDETPAGIVTASETPTETPTGTPTEEAPTEEPNETPADATLAEEEPTPVPGETQETVPDDEFTLPEEQPDDGEETLETGSDNVNDNLNGGNTAFEMPIGDYLDFSALNAAEQYETAKPIVLGFEEFIGKTLRVYGTYRSVNGGPHLYISDGNGNYLWIELDYDGELPPEGDPITVEGQLDCREDTENGSCPVLLVLELTVEEI